MLTARDGAAARCVYHVAGRQRDVRRRPRADAARQRRRRGPASCKAAAAAGVPRLVLTSSAATLGEAPGTVGREDTVHRGWYLSNYERSKTEGERAALAAGREAGIEVVSVNPSSVQGPGRAGGTGRFLLAFLDGRLKVFVEHPHQPRRHRRLRRRATSSPPSAASPASATCSTASRCRSTRRWRSPPRGRRRPHAANGARALAVGGGVDRREGRAPGRAQAAGLPRDGPHAAARPPLRRLARGARAGPRVHRARGDDPPHRRLGARRPGC